MKKILLVLAALALAGCSTEPKRPVPVPDCLLACDHVVRELSCASWGNTPQGGTCDAWLCTLPLKGATLSCYRAATTCGEADACK